MDPEALETPATLKPLRDRPATSVAFLVANEEGRALDAWRRLEALGVQNLYVVEGGMNRWLELYPPPACVAEETADPAAAAASDEPRWRLAYATGASLPSAWPELAASRSFRIPCDHQAPHAEGGHGERWPAHPYTKRVKLQARSAVTGGCG